MVFAGAEMISAGHEGFFDRRDAGRRLAAALQAYAGKDVVVLALPRGGVPVAFEVAMALGAPLDIVLVRKIGAPGNPELAIGAIAEGEPLVMVLDDETVRLFQVSEDYIATAKARDLVEISRRRKAYLGDTSQLDIAGKTVIVVDDGVATGNTMAAALASVRAAGASRIVVAVPVGAHGALEALRGVADEVVCMSSPKGFQAVGLHYADFSQTSDEEVTSLLTAARAARV